MSAGEDFYISGASLSIYRDAPSLNGARTAAIGEFACDTALEGAEVIRKAMAKLKAEGFEAVLGPMNENTWGTHRLVIESDGRPPFVMEPTNPPMHVEAFDLSGLKVVSRYVSAARPALASAGVSAAPAGLKLRQIDLANAERDLRAIHAVSLRAFARNEFYVPVTAEQFIGSYFSVLRFIDPELVLLAENSTGDLQAFLFAIPNLVEEPKPTAVVLKTYASLVKGGGSMLANAFHQRAADKGFTDVIHALMHESNLSALHSDKTGGKIFRRYALWGGAL